MRKMMKKWFSLILAGSVLVSLAPVDTSADSAKVDVWVENSLKTVYRGSILPQNSTRSISVVSARNEYESAQIALRSEAAFTISGVEFSDLESAVGDRMDSSNLRYHFAEYELIDTVKANAFNPDRVGDLIYPPSAIPDPLSNEPSAEVAANSTQPVLITNYVPSGATPGIYDGIITVKTTIGDYTVPISVEVGSAEIPRTSDSRFVNYQWAMTNGFTWDGFSWDGSPEPTYDTGENYYGVEMYSDEWFALLDRFAGVMTEYRQNMIWIRTDLLLQAGGTYLSAFTDGIPENIDWSFFDRYVQTFIDQGVDHFANTHLIHALNYMPAAEKPGDSWNAGMPESLPVTDKFLENYMTALHDHLKSKGWLNEDSFTWYQHIRDEPTSEKDRNYWTYIASKLKQIVPDFKTMDADPNGVLMNDITKPYVDVWVPLTPAFHEKKTLYKAEQAAGKDLWAYTCDLNQPPWLNRFWTQPTLTGRLLFWNLNQDGVQGHLHWAWNAWYVGSYIGDSTIVYPDKKNMTVKSSLRYEAQRDGLEDYELLDIVKRTDPALAKRIADSAVSPADPRKYTLDPAYIKTLHDYLVRAASGGQAGEVPQPVSPYDGQEMPMSYMTDNTSGDIRFSGNWSTRNRQFAYLGGVSSTSVAGDYAEYTFSGSGVDVVIEKNDGAGRFSVSVDGSEPVILDAYEKVQHDYFTIYSKRGLAPGKHTIKVENLGNTDLSIDAFRVHMYEGQKLYDASLKSLAISDIPSFSFNSGVTDYQILVPGSINTISITAALTDAAGTLAIGAKRVDSGTTYKVDIPIGKSKLVLLSTASDGETLKRYTLNFLKGNKNEPEVNVARDASGITASAVRPGDGGIAYGPQKMIDGSYGTMYASWQEYMSTHPLPHEIVLSWDKPKAFNTIVMATSSGLIQGITDIDVQVSKDGINWETVAQRVPFIWKSNKDDGVMEYTYANIPAVSGALKMRIQINEAYYTWWNMYAVYELELYQLPDNGELGSAAIDLPGLQRELSDYIASGDVKGPLVKQLQNKLRQAGHHYDKDSVKQAVKQLNDFIEHIRKDDKHASQQAKTKLTADAQDLIISWSQDGRFPK
ncbi:glycoside hydrolase domain-containing protein [Paenibacillus nasutitermitis]|uniref:F5/8 type C domain-containing protein n=1 Tax=Paenibacillus nasutitermitis TaxID=1652958 RepID=A0A916YY63_9BACL|nr:glycoside hydrolase domain-containing protein [Paenibacillus nasutitermitis]GGD66213.1 hypothetical protein GCM10010911_24970 [Paenibacillus nasutitermitis]